MEIERQLETTGFLYEVKESGVLSQIVARGFVGVEGLSDRLETLAAAGELDEETVQYNMDLLQHGNHVVRSVVEHGLIATAKHDVFEIGIERFSVPYDIAAELAGNGLVTKLFHELKHDDEFEVLYAEIGSPECAPRSSFLFVAPGFSKRMIYERARGGGINLWYMLDAGKRKWIYPLDDILIRYLDHSAKQRMGAGEEGTAGKRVVTPGDIVRQSLVEALTST
jgi:hypothetical protein